jgi:tetratricopeptide (TPR) repeat protein
MQQQHKLAVAFFLWICLIFAGIPGLAAEKPINLARAAAAKGDWETAVTCVQDAIAEDEADPDAWAIWGDAQMANGDTSEAIAKYETAIQYDPETPRAILVLTQYYLQQKDTVNAERVVRAAEKQDTKGKVDEIRAARGMILAQQGNFSEATRILASVAAKNPKNPVYPQVLARLYNSANVKEQAAKYYADAWALNPGDLTLAYEYGLVLQDLEQYSQALDLFKVVQDKNPDNKTVDYLIGRLYYAAGKWGEAAAQFQLAVQKRPDHFLSQYLLGKSIIEYSKEQKANFYKQAEVALRKAYELRPARTDVAMSLAEVLEIEGRLEYQFAVTDTAGKANELCDSSLTYFHEVQILNPGSRDLNSYMARVWFKKGDLDSTIFYTKLVLIVKPDDEGELARLVNAQQRKKDQAGVIETLQPRFDKLDWTVKKAPEDTTVTAQDGFMQKYGGILSNAYAENSQGQEARKLLTTMLGYNPLWKDGHVLNAYLDLRKQNWAGAVPVLQEAVKALPKDPELWVMLGDSWYFSNPKKRDIVIKARDCYQKAMTLGSKDGAEKYHKLEAVR